jgi:predicted TIM-barrel fold metal-dependent hydrolase
MKIIDCHIHCSESNQDALVGFARANGLKYNLGELLTMMEDYNVSSGLLLSPPKTNGKPVPNKEILRLCRKSKGKLFPIVTVEPSSSAVSECLELAKKNKGYTKGFKILLGYFPVYPAHKVYSRIYDYAESTDLPVMFHTGDTASKTASLEHANPLSLDVLANKRQSLKIVACHFGNPWFHETAELLYKHPNVYADISGLFSVGAKYSNQYLKYLARAVSEAIYFVGSAEKIIFGTDYPVERYSDAIKFTKSLQLELDDIGKIFSENAKKVFQL